MQKALTFMDMKLHHVVSDVIGVAGLRIIRATVAGERDPQVLATGQKMMRMKRMTASRQRIAQSELPLWVDSASS